MGLGRFKDGKFDLVVVANFVMTDADWTEWERGLKKASEILFNASEGQMQFGSIYICDENIGADAAEFILHASGDPSYGTWGLFGTPGAAVHLMPYVKRQVLTVLHEMGHHVWRLGEEYSVAPFFDEIDDSSPAPDLRTIPIVDSGRAVDELATMNADAILGYGDLIERRAVIANTATTVTVDSDYPDLPTNSDSTNVQYQAPAECAASADPNFCIMEHSRSAAGSFNAAGVWTDAAHPITEYCSPSDHDPDNDTDQEERYGRSCWEMMREREGFETLAMPDPAVAGPTAGFTDPSWIVLDKQPRFVLVLDRSGSMASGHKMADAQHGAVYWLEFCSVDDDLLAVIWYDHAIDRILNLVQVDTVGDLTPVEDAVNALTPRGSTNIRDGLFEALDQIQSLDTRAATQVALLLTDGKHNTPSGSSVAEALPDFQNAGVRIYSLGVGTPAAVDMDTLDELADGTGGRSFAVGDDEPGQVEAAMVEINAEVRGGIITTSPASFPDAKRSPLDEWASAKKRPSLREILEALQLGVEHLRRPHPRLVVIPVMVEAKCSRASFTLIFPEAERLWLYLVDPDGRIVDMAAAGVHLRQSTAPHEFAIVDAPKAGRWLLIAVRRTSGPAFTFRAVAGGENINLQVFGAALTANAAGAPVRIWARARWLHELSNITVTATVVSPTGEKVHITLRDGGGSQPEDGLYEGYYTPSHPGRHSGIIRIRSTGRARIAQAYHLAAHRMEKSISLRVKVPSFVREIPIYFDAGARRPVKDVEKEKGLVDKYRKERKRARKLQSAKRVQASRKRGTTRPKGRVTNAMRRKPRGRSKR